MNAPHIERDSYIMIKIETPYTILPDQSVLPAVSVGSEEADARTEGAPSTYFQITTVSSARLVTQEKGPCHADSIFDQHPARQGRQGLRYSV